MFVVDLSVGRNPSDLIVMINPEFVSREGMQLEEEGCLSAPGFNATVVRPRRAVVRGLDRQETEQTIEATDLLARAFQHEMDHLDGTVFVDRLRGIKRDMIVRKIQKLQSSGKMVARTRSARSCSSGRRRSPFPALIDSAGFPHRVVAVVSQPDRPKGRGHRVQPTPTKTGRARRAASPSCSRSGSRRRVFARLVRA